MARTKMTLKPVSHPNGGAIKAARDRAAKGPNPKVAAAKQTQVEGKIAELKAKHEEQFGPTEWSSN